MLFTDWLFLLVFMLKCTIRILFNKKNLSDKVIYIYISFLYTSRDWRYTFQSGNRKSRYLLSEILNWSKFLIVN